MGAISHRGLIMITIMGNESHTSHLITISCILRCVSQWAPSKMCSRHFSGVQELQGNDTSSVLEQCSLRSSQPGTCQPPGWPCQDGLRLKWAKGRVQSKEYEQMQVLRMEFSIVENLRGLQESSFSLFRSPATQSSYETNEKHKKTARCR